MASIIFAAMSDRDMPLIRLVLASMSSRISSIVLGSSFLVAALVWDLVGLCSSAFDRDLLPGSHLRTAGMWHEMAVFEAVFEHLFTGVRDPGRHQDMDCSLQTPASVSAEATRDIGRARG
jgi:hypothetical protein